MVQRVTLTSLVKGSLHSSQNTRLLRRNTEVSADKRSKVFFALPALISLFIYKTNHAGKPRRDTHPARLEFRAQTHRDDAGSILRARSASEVRVPDRSDYTAEVSPVESIERIGT